MDFSETRGAQLKATQKWGQSVSALLVNTSATGSLGPNPQNPSREKWPLRAVAAPLSARHVVSGSRGDDSHTWQLFPPLCPRPRPPGQVLGWPPSRRRTWSGCCQKPQLSPELSPPTAPSPAPRPRHHWEANIRFPGPSMGTAAHRQPGGLCPLVAPENKPPVCLQGLRAGSRTWITPSSLRVLSR